jgi:hypothetical protein
MQRASALGLTGDAMKQYVLDETSSLRTSENVDAAWRALAVVFANEPTCNSIFKLIMTPIAHSSSQNSSLNAIIELSQLAFSPLVI